MYILLYRMLSGWADFINRARGDRSPLYRPVYDLGWGYERRWKYAETDLLATEDLKWKSALLQVFLSGL